MSGQTLRIAVLLSMVLFEITIPLYFNSHLSMIPGIVLLVLMLVFLRKGFIDGIFRKPTVDLLKRVISSNVRNVKLAAVIVLLFLAELTWLMDSAYSLLFSGSSYSCIAWVAFIQSIICMAVLLFIYPYAPAPDIKLDNRRQVFSGISVSSGGFNWMNADLLFKPFFNAVVPVEDGSVRQFLFNIDKLIIVLSKSINFSERMIDMESFRRVITDLDTRLKYAGVDDMAFSGGTEADHNKFNIFLHVVLRYKIESNKNLSEEERAKFLAQERRMVILWRSPSDLNHFYVADYNDFKETFVEIRRSIKEYEKPSRTYETLLYISPGTSISTGAVSAMSLQGSRLILYQTQDMDEVHAINPNIEAVEDYLKEMANDLS